MDNPTAVTGPDPGVIADAAAALDQLGLALSVFDGESRLRLANEAFAAIYRLAPGQVRAGMTLAEIVALREAANTGPAMAARDYVAWRARVAQAAQRFESRVELRDGRSLVIVHQSLPDGGWVSTHEDVTERQRRELQSRQLGWNDPATGLASNAVLAARLEALARPGAEMPVAVLVFDIDRFKSVTQMLGLGLEARETTQALLRQIAERLSKVAGGSALLARLAADRFVLVQTGETQPQAARTAAWAMQQALDAPFEAGGRRLLLHASVGIALAAEYGGVGACLARADLALLRAKSEGGGRIRFYEPEMDAHHHRSQALEMDLRHALENGEFEIHYQPFLDLLTNEIVGFEALARWRHPARGMVPPTDFIPLAEQTGLIEKLGSWVLETACRTVALWPGAPSIAVNLSPVQVRNPMIVATVQEALRRSGLEASRLELEITEGVLLCDGPGSLATLQRLKSLGVRISMDDFGTGYSSLGYLRNFAFDRIKIDRSFVSGLPASRDCAAIVNAILGLGRSLGIAVTAEGVETTDQLERMRQEGCDEAQGYLISRPLPAEQARALLAGRMAQALPA
ncbi:MAG: EAL domain-containing protein [Rhodospirillales bacterium]|nr:EAL domain-containing protein [Rhodospirillales bacterium]